MHTKTPAEQWIEAISNNAAALQVARASGIPQGTYWRQVQADKLTFESVVKIARAYGAPVVAGLVQLGMLEQADVDAITQLRSIREASDSDLVGEILRRLENAESSAGTAEDTRPSAPVTDIRRNVSGPLQDVEAAFDAEVNHDEDTDDLY